MKSKRLKTFLKRLNQQKGSYLFIAPTLILFTIFILIPVFASLFLSFTEYNVIQPPKWTGWNNYKTLIFSDGRFWKASRNTVIYVVGVVPPGVALSLLLAIAIDQKIRLKNFYKTMYFMPAVTSVVAISVIWKWLFAGEKYGLINHFLIKLGLNPVDWLMSPRWTMPAIMIMSIWAGLGYNMILFLAGLQTIPNVLYEAAEIDGAGAWDKFWRITLPLLKPTFVFVVIMSTIASFQVFEQVYIMTSGAGEGIGGVLDCALTIVPYLYHKGFQRLMMGYASAIAYVLFACIFGITLINLKAIKKAKIEY
jgi:multiple sugar transport system permease protein